MKHASYSKYNNIMKCGMVIFYLYSLVTEGKFTASNRYNLSVHELEESTRIKSKSNNISDGCPKG